MVRFMDSPAHLLCRLNSNPQKWVRWFCTHEPPGLGFAFIISVGSCHLFCPRASPFQFSHVQWSDLIHVILLVQLQPLVPVHQFDKLPSYYIFAGFVFIPLTQPYLHEFGEDWYNASPRRLCERALRELPKKAGQQLVILSQVLLH